MLVGALCLLLVGTVLDSAGSPFMGSEVLTERRGLSRERGIYEGPATARIQGTLAGVGALHLIWHSFILKDVDSDQTSTMICSRLIRRLVPESMLQDLG